MIKCFVIDNQPLTVKTFESYINRTPLFNLLGTAGSYQAYADLAVLADILLINTEIEPLSDEQFTLLRKRSKILILMARAGQKPGYVVNSANEFEYPGYLELPASYQVFLQEIGRLIK